MELRTSQADRLQAEWGVKYCRHNAGYGYEIEDVTGCDCFCIRCGSRHTSERISR